MKRREFLWGTLALGLTTRIIAKEKKSTGYVYDDRYLKHTLGLRRDQTHPESPERLRKINEALAAIERGRARSLLDEMNIGGADLLLGRSALERGSPVWNRQSRMPVVASKGAAKRLPLPRMSA